MAKRMQARGGTPRRVVKKRPAGGCGGRARRRRPTIILVLALSALITGFLFRRMMLPQAVHYLAYRPPDHPVAQSPGAPAALRDQQISAASNSDKGANPESLTDSDRRELDAVVRSKPK
jgi:hypothetical protein